MTKAYLNTVKQFCSEDKKRKRKKYEDRKGLHEETVQQASPGRVEGMQGGGF